MDKRPTSIDWKTGGTGATQHRPIVLFLCTGNTCRSQMAEGFLRQMAGDRYEAHSAGTDPKERVHPLAVQVMREAGVDISGHAPKGVGTYLGRLPVRHVVIVCGGAEQKCPRIFPGALTREFWPFDDPAAFDGPPDAAIDEFRAVRDLIRGRIGQWLAEQSPSTPTLPRKS